MFGSSVPATYLYCMKETKTIVYYSQIQKKDCKWYYVANSPFFLDEKSAELLAYATMLNKGGLNYRVVEREVILDQDGKILS